MKKPADKKGTAESSKKVVQVNVSDGVGADFYTVKATFQALPKDSPMFNCSDFDSRGRYREKRTLNQVRKERL